MSSFAMTYNNDQNLIFCTGFAVKIYNKIKANLNNNLPNIFNSHLSNKYEVFPKEEFPAAIAISSDNQYIMIASGIYGLTVFR